MSRDLTNEYYPNSNKHLIIPNCLPSDEYLHTFPEKSGPIRLVYIGAVDERPGGVYRIKKYLEHLGKQYEVHVYNSRRETHVNNCINHKKITREQVIPTIAQYDYGLMYFPDDLHKHIAVCSANKFYDYVAAGLGVLIPPHMTNHAQEVEKYQLGIVADYDKIPQLERFTPNLELRQQFIKANSLEVHLANLLEQL